MVRKIAFITLVLMCAGSTLVFAESSRSLETPAGENPGGFRIQGIHREQNVTCIEGRLRYANPGWVLATPQRTYLLHFGNRDHFAKTGISLAAGVLVSIEGVLTAHDLVVYNVSLKGTTYRFRDREGVPLWVGRGNSKKWRDHNFDHRLNRREGHRAVGEPRYRSKRNGPGKGR